MVVLFWRRWCCCCLSVGDGSGPLLLFRCGGVGYGVVVVFLEVLVMWW